MPAARADIDDDQRILGKSARLDKPSRHRWVGDDMEIWHGRVLYTSARLAASDRGGSLRRAQEGLRVAPLMEKVGFFALGSLEMDVLDVAVAL